MTVGHQEGSLLGPAVLVLTHRPAHPQVSLFVFLCFLPTCSRGEVLVKGGAVLRSDLQEEAQDTGPSKSLMEELFV